MGSLPTGTFVDLDASPWLIVGDEIVQWTHEGYGTRESTPGDGLATVITPPSTIDVLRAGYELEMDPSALGSTPPT